MCLKCIRTASSQLGAENDGKLILTSHRLAHTADIEAQKRAAAEKAKGTESPGSDTISLDLEPPPTSSAPQQTIEIDDDEGSDGEDNESQSSKVDDLPVPHVSMQGKSCDVDQFFDPAKIHPGGKRKR
ncbi:hypothetical protein C0992_012607, partial [Termitomyces sp. T32_za158]